MAEDKYWDEWAASLRQLDIDYRKSPHWETNGGAADSILIISGLCVPIEVKTGKNSFPVGPRKKGWRQDQRDWAHTMFDKHGTETHIALFMGTDPTNYSAPKYKPRRLWVIPFREMLRMEAEFVKKGYTTIPYRAPGTRAGYDAENYMQSEWEWEWQGSGIWSPSNDFRLTVQSVVVFEDRIIRKQGRKLKVINIGSNKLIANHNTEKER